MKRFLLGLSASFSLIFCLAMPSAGTDKNAKKKSTLPNIEISAFDVPESLEASPDFLERLARELPHELSGTKKFKFVFNEVAAPADLDGSTFQLTGTLIDFNAGSRAERYLVGFGAGKAVAVAHVKLTEMATGRTVLERDVTGKMTGGGFGGSSKGVADQLAREIARAIKKEPLQ